MLKIFKTSTIEKKIKKVKRITVDTWLELTSPTNDEIDKVVEKTLVDKDLILKMLDDEERPRVEQSGNATLIVIDTPYLEKDENGSNYKTYPLGIIITENNYVITISSKRIELLNDFKKNKVKDFRTAKKTRFLIQILLRTSNYYLRALKQVYNDMEEAEQVLKKSTEIKEEADPSIFCFGFAFGQYIDYIRSNKKGNVEYEKRIPYRNQFFSKISNRVGHHLYGAGHPYRQISPRYSGIFKPL